MEEDDLYQVLGVPYTATTKEITRAYRQAMKQSHPDRQSPVERAAAEEHAKLLNRAFTTLSKPHLRQTYDRQIRAQVVQDQIMNQYVGGFVAPQRGDADPFARHLRRELSDNERRERKRDERGALLQLILVFAAITVAIVALLVTWAALGALVESIG
jgi:DnaJ-class molecular chaperone